MGKEVRMVIATFDNRISEEELPYFRGCMIKESCGNPLFHNHKEDNYNYTYPLVQYKRDGNRTLMVGINEGGEAIESLLRDKGNIPCSLGNRKTELQLIGTRSQIIPIGQTSTPHTYTIRGWIPLNSDNYQSYQQTTSLVERVKMLEKILTGNILSFAKGIGVQIDYRIHCSIVQLDEEKPFTYKGIMLKSFTAQFRTNIELPDYIGLGKSISLGKGTIKREKDGGNI
jgi:hypothetical protein